MFRLAYRNFGDHESLVGNYSVSASGVAGVRWFELRNVIAGPVTVFQESTYQPDTTWRWIGSVAMDSAGNIAVGFSASSASLNPSSRYAGRLASDPLNSLAQGETDMFDGTGSQTGTSNRWGDYSAMTVDPVDDCTFWYTNEYYATHEPVQLAHAHRQFQVRRMRHGGFHAQSDAAGAVRLRGNAGDVRHRRGLDFCVQQSRSR